MIYKKTKLKWLIECIVEQKIEKKINKIKKLKQKVKHDLLLLRHHRAPS